MAYRFESDGVLESSVVAEPLDPVLMAAEVLAAEAAMDQVIGLLPREPKQSTSLRMLW